MLDVPVSTTGLEGEGRRAFLALLKRGWRTLQREFQEKIVVPWPWIFWAICDSRRDPSVGGFNVKRIDTMTEDQTSVALPTHNFPEFGNSKWTDEEEKRIQKLLEESIGLEDADFRDGPSGSTFLLYPITFLPFTRTSSFHNSH